MAGSSTAEPSFYFDLASPACYLAAERILHTLPVPWPWVPVLAERLPGERVVERERVEREAARLALQPMRWPAELPFDARIAQLGATYARQIGKGVAFAQAAFRQVFAGGRDLSVPDNVLIAGSACEMHPSALLKAFELRSVASELDRATGEALERGATTVPAIWTGSELFCGPDALDRAAEVVVA